jgi:hypothetical protein
MKGETRTSHGVTGVPFPTMQLYREEGVFISHKTEKRDTRLPVIVEMTYLPVPSRLLSRLLGITEKTCRPVPPRL